MEELFPNIYRVETIIKVAPLIGGMRSAMHVIKSGDELVLMDPFSLHGSEAESLEQLGKPTTILIANTSHVRDAEQYRKRYGAKILANRAAVRELGVPVDEAFGDGDRLPGDLTAIDISVAGRGETIFRYEGGKERKLSLWDNFFCGLITGDALFNLQKADLTWLTRLVGFRQDLRTMPKLMMKDKKRTMEVYHKLLDHSFDWISVSHGAPILSQAKNLLQKALNNPIAG
jgi:hypothetical protein